MNSNKTSPNNTPSSPFRGLGGSTFAFIGAGKVGTSLGMYFKRNGFDIQGYYSRTLKSAEHAAELTNSNAFSEIDKLVESSDIIWITTSDDAIQSIVDQIDKLKFTGSKIFIHASGLLTSDVMEPLRMKGHHVFSVHPLLAFNHVEQAVNTLPKTTFFIEGEKDQLGLIHSIFEQTGNKCIEIEKSQKPAYHAAACVLSNYMVTLVHASNLIFELAGVSQEDLNEATKTLTYSVLDNLEHNFPKNALTGPIKRGDAETVKKHIEILEHNLPELTELYKILGKETMRMIGANKPPYPQNGNFSEIADILE